MDDQKYILGGPDGHTLIPATLMEWAEWMETADRIVAKEVIGNKRVSTVFLGLNHNYGEGPPLLFEAMIFPMDSYADEYCDHCSTWEEAEAMHEKACEIARAGEVVHEAV